MFTSDYKKLPEQILLDLINNDNGTSFEVGQLLFRPPSVRANDDGQPAFNNRLTKIRVAAVEGTGYKNYVDMNYRRIHYRDVFEITADDGNVEFPVVDLTFDLGENTKLSDLLPVINERYALNLQPNDFWEKSLPVFEGPPPYAPAYVRLEAKAESPIFIGGVRIRINPNDYELALRLPNTELEGLVYDNTEWMIPPSYAPFHQFVATQLTAPGFW